MKGKATWKPLGLSAKKWREAAKARARTKPLPLPRPSKGREATTDYSVTAFTGSGLHGG